MRYVVILFIKILKSEIKWMTQAVLWKEGQSLFLFLHLSYQNDFKTGYQTFSMIRKIN